MKIELGHLVGELKIKLVHLVGELKIKLVHLGDELMRLTVKDHCHNAVSVWKKLGVKPTQVNACMATADRDRQGQGAYRQYKFTVFEVTSGEGQA